MEGPRLLMSLLPVLLILHAYQVQLVSASGSLSIRFNRYLNPEGKGKSSHCCDGRWKFCTSECDQYFVVCVDDISSPDTTTPCRYGKVETAPIEDQNSIDFRLLSNVGGIPNPIVFKMDPLKTDISIKVAVYDKDTRHDDDVDFLRTNIGRGLHEVDVGERKMINITHRTTLEIEVSFKCDGTWYGHLCQVSCSPPSSDEKYVCDIYDGHKICDEGWEGPRCSTKSNPCREDMCENWGTCNWDGQTQSCICSEEFSGPRCEIDLCMETCKPGVCLRAMPGIHGYMCHCPGGYEDIDIPNRGDSCQLRTTEMPHPSSEIPTTIEELPPSETPTTEETPLPSETPTTEETPLPSEKPTTEETPLSSEKPTTEETPLPSENPTTEETPLSSEKPTTEETPLPSETPTPEETQFPSEKPTTEETPLPSERPTPEEKPDIIDCDVIKKSASNYPSGIYNFRLGNRPSPIEVYCDMSGSNGWTYLMYRGRGDANFFTNWTEYKEGFGKVGPNTDHWIGLENMYQLTRQRRYKLRVDMKKSNNMKFYAEYDDFRVDSEISKYKLHVSGYSGTAGDGLGLTGYDTSRSHNEQPFSTYDQDNDQFEGHCAVDFQSGWWFNNCYAANLNGAYKTEVDPDDPTPCNKGMCIQWRTLSGYHKYSLKEAIMRITPH